jgi:hypothetical protein
MRTTTEVLHWFQDARIVGAVQSDHAVYYDFFSSVSLFRQYCAATPIVSDLTVRSILAQPKARLRPGRLGRLMQNKGRRSLLLPRKASRPPRRMTIPLLMTALATWRKWKNWRTLTTRSSLTTVCLFVGAVPDMSVSACWLQQRSFVKRFPPVHLMRALDRALHWDRV